MIDIKDERDVQIWCDYQEEVRQVNTNYFLRLRFFNFRTFVATVVNYNNVNCCSSGNLDGYGDGYGQGNGNGYSGIDYGYENSYNDGDGLGYGFSAESTS